MKLEVTNELAYPIPRLVNRVQYAFDWIRARKHASRYQITRPKSALSQSRALNYDRFQHSA